MKRIGLFLLLVVLVSSLFAQKKNITWNVDGSEMVLIPAGSFEMGDHFNEGKDNEKPVHVVELDAFIWTSMK